MPESTSGRRGTKGAWQGQERPLCTRLVFQARHREITHEMLGMSGTMRASEWPYGPALCPGRAVGLGFSRGGVIGIQHVIRDHEVGAVAFARTVNPHLLRQTGRLTRVRSSSMR
jgi:hypothetical protein